MKKESNLKKAIRRFCRDYKGNKWLNIFLSEQYSTTSINFWSYKLNIHIRIPTWKRK